MLKITEKMQRELLKCPRCKKNMDKWEHSGVILDICRKCGGMWVDKGELDKIYKIIGGKK